METKANYVLIGAFALALVASFFGFVLWMAKVEIDREVVLYDTYFEEAVTGLSLASDVRYSGVPIGEVVAIELDPSDPSRVRVTLEVAANAPIRVDSVAALDFLGVTGVSYVQITGGSADSPALTAGPGERYPVIPSRQSALAELFSGAPDLINRSTLLVAQVTKLVDDKNRKALASIMVNLDEVTTSLARRTGAIEETLANAATTSAELARAAAAVRELAEQTGGTLGRLNSLLEQDLPGFIQAATAGAKSFDKLSSDIDAVVLENREAIGDFTSTGLARLVPLITEINELVATLTRVAERIENDPARFLMGTSEAEFEAR